MLPNDAGYGEDLTESRPGSDRSYVPGHHDLSVATLVAGWLSLASTRDGVHSFRVHRKLSLLPPAIVISIEAISEAILTL
jgi:hypothetical protein